MIAWFSSFIYKVESETLLFFTSDSIWSNSADFSCFSEFTSSFYQSKWDLHSSPYSVCPLGELKPKAHHKNWWLSLFNSHHGRRVHSGEGDTRNCKRQETSLTRHWFASTTLCPLFVIWQGYAVQRFWENILTVCFNVDQPTLSWFLFGVTYPSKAVF